ncbi:MAG: nitroreductase family protein [Ignavibacteriaceae bacterium]|nr:nitroreductase family protein [Ignavibacteriaceae bacterium]
MNELLKLMQERQSVRSPLDTKRPIAGNDLLLILEAGRWAPTAHNMQNFEIIVVNNINLLEAIGNIKRPISETFIRENYMQLSFSEEELRKKKTGLLASMFPPSWRNPDFRLDNILNDDSSMQRPLPSCPAMMFVVYNPANRAPASEGDFLGSLSLGCVMENMWLMANSLGICFHIVSSLSSGTVENEVKSILNIPQNLSIAFPCRLGYSVSTPIKRLRVRRDVKDFTYFNKYGSKDL